MFRNIRKETAGILASPVYKGYEETVSGAEGAGKDNGDCQPFGRGY